MAPNSTCKQKHPGTHLKVLLWVSESQNMQRNQSPRNSFVIKTPTLLGNLRASFGCQNVRAVWENSPLSPNALFHLVPVSIHFIWEEFLHTVSQHQSPGPGWEGRRASQVDQAAHPITNTSPFLFSPTCCPTWLQVLMGKAMVSSVAFIIHPWTGVRGST